MDPNEETNTIVAILRLQPQICKQVEIVMQRLRVIVPFSMPFSMYATKMR